MAVDWVLLGAKLDALRSHLRPGTVLYSQYVDGQNNDKIIVTICNYVRDCGLRPASYTGTVDELDMFLSGDADVLVASAPIATGVDGLQHRADQLIVISPPWTGAGMQQLIGRFVRTGGKFSHLTVVLPEVVIPFRGERFSWDSYRYGVIDDKQTLADAALDGTLPDHVAITEAELRRKAYSVLSRWLTNLEGHESPSTVVPETLPEVLPEAPAVRQPRAKSPSRKQHSNGIKNIAARPEKAIPQTPTLNEQETRLVQLWAQLRPVARHKLLQYMQALL